MMHISSGNDDDQKETSPLSIREEGDETSRGETCVLIRASKYTKDCGLGTRKNFYLLDDYTTEPPPPLEEDGVDVRVWKRLYGRIVASKTFERQFSTPAIIIGIPWAVFFLIGDILDDERNRNGESEEKMPAWFVTVFSILSVLLFITIYRACKKGNTASLLAEEKAVAKMRMSFERNGYNIEYMKLVSACGIMATACTYIRFTRTPNITPSRSTSRSSPTGSEEEEEEEEPPAAYCAQSWIPLEGIWKQIDDNGSPQHIFPKWLFNISERTIEVGGAADERTFGMLQKSQLRKCFGLCSEERLIVCRPEGNQLVIKSPSKLLQLVERSIAETSNDEIKSQLIQLRDDYRREMMKSHVFYPLQEEPRSGSANFYRNKSGGSVWKVEGPTLIIYPDLEDDWLSDDDILNGRLDDIQDEDTKRIEYKLIQHNPAARDPSGWDDASETPRSQQDAYVVTASGQRTMLLLKLTSSVQLPALVGFFSFPFNAASSPALTAWLIITGIFGLNNFIHSYIMAPCCMPSNFLAVISSGLYLFCFLVLFIGILVSWDDWTPFWQLPEVVFVVVILTTCLVSAAVNFYAYCKLKSDLSHGTASDAELSTHNPHAEIV